MAELTAQPVPAAERHRLGQEHVPLVIIDDAHPAPRSLCEMAQTLSFDRGDDDFYPGVRAQAPAGYGDWLAMLVAVVWPGNGMSLVRTAFAVATDTPSDLAPIQRIPHFDTVDPQMVAAVHYLCEPPCGGTDFYRHRRTGYERIDRSRQAAWRQALNRDVRDFGRPADCDLPGDAPAFACIGSVALRFNRLILYPANCLHAGDLRRAAREGGSIMPRLTATSLLQP